MPVDHHSRSHKCKYFLFCILVMISGCAQTTGKQNSEPVFDELNVIDATQLNEVMLTVADPNEAITYFRRASRNNPDRIDHKRGLASSLVRAKQYSSAVPIWKTVTQMGGATPEDRINYIDALVRSGDWDTATQKFANLADKPQSFERHRLEALLADHNEKWETSDAHYEVASTLTSEPSGILNNWGYSKLSRGEYAKAERLFTQAIRLNPTQFTAKNNLTLARGAQRKYTLPVIPMDQKERALLLHTLALTAIKQGDTLTGQTLLEEAIKSHPQHFSAAVQTLHALQNSKPQG